MRNRERRFRRHVRQGRLVHRLSSKPRPPHNKRGGLAKVRLGLHLQPLFSLGFSDTGPSKDRRCAKKIGLSNVNITPNEFGFILCVSVSD